MLHDIVHRFIQKAVTQQSIYAYYSHKVYACFQGYTLALLMLHENIISNTIFLGCDTIYSGTCLLTFQRMYCLYLQGLRVSQVSRAYSSDTSVNFYQTIWHHIPEDGTFHSHH
jgi:hypothetical protein